jgi:hypothetical protein
MLAEKRPETRVEVPISDFLSEDIDKLMNTPVEAENDDMDADAMFSAYDRELLSFKHTARRQQTWPQPIRKR